MSWSVTDRQDVTTLVMEKKQKSSHNEETFYYLQFLGATNIYIYFLFVYWVMPGLSSVDSQWGIITLNTYQIIIVLYCEVFYLYLFIIMFFSLLIFIQFSSLPEVSILGGGDCSDRPDQNESWSGRLWYI